MTRTPSLTLGLFCTLGLASCDLEQPQEVTLRVDHFREPCPDGGSGYCLRILEGTEPSVSYAREIAGFEHHWGTVYEVRALVAEDSDGIPSFDLVEVVEASPVAAGARFHIDLPPTFVVRVDSSTLDLVGQTRARCETPDVCDAVVEALYEDAPVNLELSHQLGRDGAFVAHAAAVRH